MYYVSTGLPRRARGVAIESGLPIGMRACGKLGVREPESSEGEKMRIGSMITVLAGVAAVAGSASAFVPWSNPNGNGAWFSWSGGGSDNGYWGSPVVINSGTFIFFPNNFRADTGVSGSPATKADRLQFTLTAFVGYNFSNVDIQEFGDYGIDPGTGSVTANMGMFVTDDVNSGPGGFPRVASDNQTFTTSTPGFGNWNVNGGVALNGQPLWQTITIVVDNNLIAIHGPNGTSFIEKKVGGIIIHVPTPGTLALAGAGSLVAVRRRRR